MKKNVLKTVFAAICFVAAGISGMKAYNADNMSEADMLFTENIEALSSGAEGGNGYEKKSESDCPVPFEYKKSRTCQRTTKNTSCTESDCF